MTNKKIIPPPRMWINGKYLPVVSISYVTQQATAIDGNNVHVCSLSDLELPSPWVDRNGDAIYQGHIINTGIDSLYEVVCQHCDFYLTSRGESYADLRGDFSDSVIVGSVRENPDLAAKVRGE